MIALESITFSYRSTLPIFESFSWQAAAGEAWTVLGPSGCGKSTLLYLLSGLLRPAGGAVRIDGQVLERPRPRSGLVLQDYGLLPWATVRDNVTLGLRIRDFYGPDGKHAPGDEDVQQIQARGLYWLKQLDLTEIASQYPGQISGGQRQRVAIARTLALNPDLLLMDEPFGSLDAPTRQGLQCFMLHLHAETGLTMVVVTHSIEEAALLGKKVLVLARPPNRQALTFENPHAGESGYADNAAYTDLCSELRRALEAAR